MSNNLNFIFSHLWYLMFVKEKDARKHIKLPYRHQLCSEDWGDFFFFFNHSSAGLLLQAVNLALSPTPIVED